MKQSVRNAALLQTRNVKVELEMMLERQTTNDLFPYIYNPMFDTQDWICQRDAEQTREFFIENCEFSMKNILNELPENFVLVTDEKVEKRNSFRFSNVFDTSMVTNGVEEDYYQELELGSDDCEQEESKEQVNFTLDEKPAQTQPNILTESFK